MQNIPCQIAYRKLFIKRKFKQCQSQFPPDTIKRTSILKSWNTKRPLHMSITTQILATLLLQNHVEIRKI